MENNINIPALIENWHIVYDFLDKKMKEKGIIKDYITPVLIASEEIYVNISNYAYPGKTGDVSIHFEYDTGENPLKVKFIDSGIPFDPTKVKVPDIKEPIEKRKIGGLGIFIVNKIMDGMEYAHECGQNNLIIFKKIK